jgi:hypothetical protein
LDAQKSAKSLVPEPFIEIERATEVSSDIVSPIKEFDQELSRTYLPEQRHAIELEEIL